ncbi:hypothetical protein F2Q68_00025872 [Brassica cretica]|uniref:Uncharacterized protein n=1 Tax=Brassica cretica TaxID=69181 RepID=A0A8S9IEJ8_BRACR|nr:hypothetical protein F2Q68_00025872 [Brassica cretica]
MATSSSYDLESQVLLLCLTMGVFLDFDPIATSELTNRQHPLRLQPPHYHLHGKTKLARNITKNSHCFCHHSLIVPLSSGGAWDDDYENDDDDYAEKWRRRGNGSATGSFGSGSERSKVWKRV